MSKTTFFQLAFFALTLMNMSCENVEYKSEATNLHLTSAFPSVSEDDCCDPQTLKKAEEAADWGYKFPYSNQFNGFCEGQYGGKELASGIRLEGYSIGKPSMTSSQLKLCRPNGLKKEMFLLGNIKHDSRFYRMDGKLPSDSRSVFWPLKIAKYYAANDPSNLKLTGLLKGNRDVSHKNCGCNNEDFHNKDVYVPIAFSSNAEEALYAEVYFGTKQLNVDWELLSCNGTKIDSGSFGAVDGGGKYREIKIAKQFSGIPACILVKAKRRRSSRILKVYFPVVI